MAEQKNIISSFNQSSKDKQKINLSSRKKWFWLGVVIALINPIFSGLILGIAFLTEPEMKKEGKIILILAILWGLVSLYLSGWLAQQGYLPS